MALCHRQTQIHRFYSKFLFPFMISVNFFLIPCRTDTCSVCQPSETDYKWFYSPCNASLHRCELQSNGSYTSPTHLQFHCLSVLQLLQSLPNCISIFYLTCSSNFCLCSGLCLISCYHKMFTEYFPVMMNTLLKVFIPPHPPLLFYLPRITGWQFFTFHTFHQKHLHLLFSILLLCLTF